MGTLQLYPHSIFPSTSLLLQYTTMTDIEVEECASCELFVYIRAFISSLVKEVCISFHIQPSVKIEKVAKWL